MDINPLSLLEVTMGSDPVENNEDDDDDCIIVDTPIETHVIDDTPDPVNPDPEPEMVAGAGYHFLQQTEDPLSLADSHATTNSNMSYFWVNTNINNLTNVTPAEREFRHMHYKDIHNVLQDRLHCTICQDHIGCDIRLHSKAIEHPVLKVLVCERCTTNYKSLQFPLNGHGKETRCRWCGKSPMGGGTPLRRCQQCPFSFCQTCLANNLPNNQPKPGTLWTCCVCNMKLLWPARSLLWALQTLKDRFLSRSIVYVEDMSVCAERCLEDRQIKGKERKKSAQSKNVVPKISASRQSMQQPQMVNPGPSHTQKQIQQYPFSKIVSPPSQPEVRNGLLKTTWFTSKLESYENDVLSLANKIKKIRESCNTLESVQTFNTKVETATTILSLNSNLFKDCSLNLMNEWKEKKSRQEIDNINLNTTSSSHQIPEVLLPSINSAINVTSLTPHESLRSSITQKIFTYFKNNNQRSVPNRKTPAKNKKKINRSTSNVKRLNKLQLLRMYGIKDCYVKLERLPINIIQEKSKILSNSGV